MFANRSCEEKAADLIGGQRGDVREAGEVADLKNRPAPTVGLAARHRHSAEALHGENKERMPGKIPSDMFRRFVAEIALGNAGTSADHLTWVTDWDWVEVVVEDVGGVVGEGGTDNHVLLASRWVAEGNLPG